MHKGLAGLIGTSLARSGFFSPLFLLFAGGIGVAAGRPSGRDFCTHAAHGVGARHWLCRGHSFKREIRLYHPIVFSTMITMCLIAAAWLSAKSQSEAVGCVCSEFYFFWVTPA